MFQRIAIRKENGEYLFGEGILEQLEIFNVSDLKLVDNFLERNKGSNVFFILSYELGVALLDTTVHADKPRSNYPLAKFWVANTNETESNPGPDEWINNFSDPPSSTPFQGNWKFGSTKENYLERIETIQKHIQRGDCYELNFCQHIEANGKLEDGLELFKHVREITNAPHSAYFEDENIVLASGSPERFIKKTGNMLYSQPIKGTAARGKTAEEDQKIIAGLKSSEKDFVENVMIVDLVRNDCSKIAAKGSVKVEELSQLYTFETVHQLISTISCELKEDTTFSQIIEAMFPMGSMTGAPKRSAVQLSENYETHARNWYSGSIGYIDENGDFDSNVLIRTVFFDKQKEEFSCMVGGAITHLSDPELEWEECKIKVGRIIDRFGTCHW